MEEKHQEECHLYQVQLSQIRHELEEANLKVKRQNDKHVHIERHLYKFMESLRQDHVATLDDINSFKTRSFNNLEEILSLNGRNGGVEDKHKGKEDGSTSQMTYRLGETPLSSRSEVKMGKKKDSLQDTIQMVCKYILLGIFTLQFSLVLVTREKGGK